MADVTAKLAESLRKLQSRLDPHDYPDEQDAAREALAAYEQAQAQPVQDERAAFEAWKEGNAFLGIEPTWAAWKARAELAATPAPAPVWQPIETAPKDRAVLVWFSELNRGMVDIAKLDDDKYAKKPRPYWSGYFERVLGILAYRNGKPTHWMPLPAAPEAGQGKKPKA